MVYMHLFELMSAGMPWLSEPRAGSAHRPVR
jgi:hypothetical protein